MMKTCITLILTCCSLLVFGQNKAKRDSIEKRIKSLEDSVFAIEEEIQHLENELYSLDTIGYANRWRAKHASEFFSLDIMYSNKFYDHGFYDQLNSIHRISAGKSQHYIGFRLTGELTTSRELSGPGCLGVSQLLPFDILVNDSIKAKVTAFNAGVSLFGIDLLRKNKHFELFALLGVNVGRARIYGDDRVQAKNPYFAPKLTVMPRIVFWHFVLSCTAEYDFDISGTRWKKMIFGPGKTIYLQSFRQSGFSLSAALGINFY